MDQVPTPSAIFSMELPAQPKPQQGERSATLEGSGVTRAGPCCWPHPFGCPHLRNTASQPLLGFILCSGDGQGGLWASLLALASGQAQILPPPPGHTSQPSLGSHSMELLLALCRAYFSAEEILSAGGAFLSRKGLAWSRQGTTAESSTAAIGARSQHVTGLSLPSIHPGTGHLV